MAEDEGMATHEQSDLIEREPPGSVQWTTSLDKIDTIQARAQIEALRAIAEQLNEIQSILWSIDENGLTQV